MTRTVARSICKRWSLPSARRKYSTTIINIPQHSNIYAFGASTRSDSPLISNLGWTVLDGEAWAVISGAGGEGKGVVFKTLLGYTRIVPKNLEAQGQWAENGGLYPFLSHSAVDPYTRISHVSFRQRTGGTSGAFFDYTARYGAIREEEDRVTLRDTLDHASQNDILFDTLSKQMGLTNLLDLPMITLSNGQTRRARVVKAILDRPELLLLDEPLTGLDPPSRKALDETMHQLHLEKAPRMIIGLRKGEQVPPWITNILEIDGRITSTRKLSSSDVLFRPAPKPTFLGSNQTTSKLLVDMKDVNVAYGDRKILTKIDWKIHQGERWHLQGTNGSGKTTLLSLLTGDHPQSYTQNHLHLPAFDASQPPDHGPTLRPRKRTPTAHLRALIGVVSPEMFDAFPRRHPGMSVWEAVTTGFDGGFVPRTRSASTEARQNGGVGCVDVADDELRLGPDASENDKEARREELAVWRIRRCWDVLGALGPAAWSRNHDESETRAFAARAFSALSAGEQRLVLLMRALVGRPPVVLLDEVWSGMDDAMIAAARAYLRTEAGVDSKQAVVVITHWEDEVPWTDGEVLRFRL